MLCNDALMSCTYLAPTAIAINPADPTQGAEPRPCSQSVFRRDVSAFLTNAL